ncbi:homeobox protein NOBOX [Mesocricetus auratus]|uniref:Homeobox protein NOBOX n=1 Tax=Mesocricetus auratus TaxID=10036 RepID=A0A1U7R0H6_MESAU|nr:homeobox protein NOBOX [Mesocricetus auratus]
MEPTETLCRKTRGQEAGGKPRTAGLESEGPLKDSAPPTEDDQDKQSSLPRTGSGKRPLSKTPKESPGTDTCRVSNHDKDLTPAACSRQPEEEVSSLPERKVKTAKPSISAVLGLAPSLLNTLAKSTQADQKKEPREVTYPFRKKTRTLYRSDQLEELERIFQEDHYPDSEKRREIAQMVGVTSHRIMVWFQNRRAKWRKVEKLSEKGTGDGPAAPGADSSQSRSAPELLAPTPADLDPGPVPPEHILDDFPELPMLLTSDQTLTPSQHSEGVQRVAVTPPLFSPPPLRRTNLPLPVDPVQTPQVMPPLRDVPGSDGIHKDSSCGSWGTSITSPPTCSSLEDLGPQDYPASSQLGSFQFSQTPQTRLFPPFLSQFPYPPPFPFPIPSFLPPQESLFSFPFGFSGDSSQDYCPGPPPGQILLQPHVGNMGPGPWGGHCLPEPPFPGPLCPQTLGQPLGIEGYFPDLLPAPCAETMSKQPSFGFNGLPKGPRPETVSSLSKMPGEQIASSLEQPFPEEVKDKTKNSHASATKE